jgi:hypothetical protein
MRTAKVIGIAVLLGLAAITAFHIVHHLLYCRYKGIPGKSHCAVCGHRRVCQRCHRGKGA